MFRSNIRSLFKANLRHYCSVSKVCWNCNLSISPSNISFVCPSCGSLQEINKKLDYFSLLGIKSQHKLDINELTKKFRKLQSQLHPDKFSNSSSTEQNLSADWSSLINKAYKTLLTPLERGEYLLKLNGIQIPEDNSSLDKEFLMEMMERNEELEELETKEEIFKFQSDLQDELAELSNQFAVQIENKNPGSAKDVLVKMKYLNSMQKKIKEKLVKFM